MLWRLDSELKHQSLLHADRARAYNVAELFFRSELCEELLTKQIVQDSNLAWFTRVMGWCVRKDARTAIIHVFVQVDALVLVHRLVVQFHASLAVQHVFVHSWEIQTSFCLVNYLQSFTLSQVAL